MGNADLKIMNLSVCNQQCRCFPRPGPWAWDGCSGPAARERVTRSSRQTATTQASQELLPPRLWTWLVFHLPQLPESGCMNGWRPALSSLWTSDASPPRVWRPRCSPFSFPNWALLQLAHSPKWIQSSAPFFPPVLEVEGDRRWARFITHLEKGRAFACFSQPIPAHVTITVEARTVIRVLAAATSCIILFIITIPQQGHGFASFIQLWNTQIKKIYMVWVWQTEF